MSSGIPKVPPYPAAPTAHGPHPAQTGLLCQTGRYSRDVTLHFTHVTWPVGIKTLSRFTLNRPHSVGCSGVCTKPTRVWASSLDTAIALESNESKV